jgi:hypothetical protein
LYLRDEFRPVGGIWERSLLSGDFSCPTPETASSSSECSAELEDDSADPSDPDDVSGEFDQRRDFSFNPGA